jgi:hypothetical protein
MALLKVVQTWYDTESETEKGRYHSGIVLELEDGRLLRHCQDGFVKPMSEVEAKTDTTLVNVPPRPMPNPTTTYKTS